MFQDIIYHPSLSYHSPLRLHLSGVSFCDGTYHIEHKPGNLFVFEYIESGRGELEVNGEIYYPEAGDLYIAPGWTHNAYRSSTDAPWVKYWWNSSGHLVENLLKLYKIDKKILFKNCPEIGQIIKETVLEIQSHGASAIIRENASERRRQAALDETELLSTRLIKLCMELSKYERHPSMELAGAGKIAETIRKRLLDSVNTEAPSLQELGELVNRSPEHVIRIFRKAYGDTPFNFLINEKISAACDLLKSSDCSLRELAFHLGFRDEFYFSRLFKSRIGVSPSVYRKS